MKTGFLALDIALTHLRFRRRQSLVSVAGVAVGVGFFIAISSLMQGSQDDFMTRLIDSAPHINMRDEYRNPSEQPVHMAFGDGAIELRGVKPREEVRGVKDWRQIVASLDARPGLRISPALSGPVIIRYGSAERGVTLSGIEPERERYISTINRDMVEGRMDDLKLAANGILIGKGLARKLTVGLGDTISVSAQAGVNLKMKIVGIYETRTTSIDEFQVFALLKRAQVLFDRPEIANRIQVKMADPSQAEDLAREMEGRFGYKSESWQERSADIMTQFVVRDLIIYTVVSAILLVASFGIFNVISTIVLEKSKDIAILKSMGFTEADVKRIFLIEGITVGLVGMLLGWALGYLLLLGLAQFEFRIQGRIENFPLDWSFYHYWIAGGASVVSATFAAWLPSRKAARVHPVEILRGAA